MLCARVVRGISSMENEVTPVAAISLKHFERSQRPQETDQHLVRRSRGRSALPVASLEP